MKLSLYQSPYKGFNSRKGEPQRCTAQGRINPPIRGSIVNSYLKKRKLLKCINPPIRGSIEDFMGLTPKTERINPPIRGSIGVNFNNPTEAKNLYQSPYKGFNRKK